MVNLIFSKIISLLIVLKKYKSDQYSGFLSNLPRLWIELIVISSFMGLFFIYINISNNSSSIITSIALYGADFF